MTETERKTAEQIVAGLVYGDNNFPERDLSLATRIVDALRAAGLLVGEPSEERVEAASKAFYEANTGLTSWERLAKADVAIANRYRGSMRAALAAAGVTPPAPSEPKPGFEKSYEDREFCGNTIAPKDNGGQWGACKLSPGHESPCVEVVPAPSPDREIESEPPSCFTSDGQIESKSAIDREKLLDEARKDIRLWGLNGFGRNGIVARLAGALAAAVEVDEAELAEVIRKRLSWASMHWDLKSPEMHQALAQAVAEWLRGGGR